MKKKLVLALTMMAVSTMAMNGCGFSAEQGDSNEEQSVEVTSISFEAKEESANTSTMQGEENSVTQTTESTEHANPWTESDWQGVINATGFDMTAPEDAVNVAYSYMSESKTAQMTYELDSEQWNYRIQPANELTDISGMNYDWDGTEDGSVAGCEAKYYSYVGQNHGKDEDIQVVNWYDAVTGVAYSLSAKGTDLNGMDIQVYAENLYAPLQGDATDDAVADREFELTNYFLGEHVRSYDSSSLTISENADGTFDVNIDIIRLCSLENGVGTFKDHKMYFDVTDPSGNTLSGMIYRDSDNSLCVKITDSTWDYLPNDDILDGFGK